VFVCFSVCFVGIGGYSVVFLVGLVVCRQYLNLVNLIFLVGGWV